MKWGSDVLGVMKLLNKLIFEWKKKTHYRVHTYGNPSINDSARLRAEGYTQGLDNFSNLREQPKWTLLKTTNGSRN